MVFSSLEFLFWFLPFFIAVYYLIPGRFKNVCLFTFSFIFYAYGALEQPFYILLILLSVTANYGVGLAMEKVPEQKKLFFTAGLIYDFAILFVYKYLDFVIENLNRICNIIPVFGENPLPMVHLILPIGISFYTFQEVSYLCDVYRGTVKAEESWLDLATYIMMFPQLIAGPIVRFTDISHNMKKRSWTLDSLKDGLRIFIIGLGFKVLLANRIGSLWTDINGIGYSSISTPLAWMGIAAFSFQLYFDFYGYSLMAIGLGKMIGFKFPKNFDHPYTSKTMTQFWRKWHMTLGTWFREYVYIPLGGNRKGKKRHILNMLIVWLFTGIWHGAGWNFVLWGLLLFAVLTLEKYYYGQKMEQSRIAGHIYMLFLIPISWLVFAVEDLGELAVYFGRLIGIGGEAVFREDWIKYGKIYGVLLLLGFLFSTTIPEKIYRRIKEKPVMWVILLAILAGSVYCLYIGLNDPFLYFRF